MLGQVQPGVNEQVLLRHSKGRPDASEETTLDQIGLLFDLQMTLQNYSCMPALVPQLPEYRDTFPIIQDPPPLLLSSTALKIRLSTILAEGMGAVYYNNTFLQEEAAAACQEVYRVMLLSAPERLLRCSSVPCCVSHSQHSQTQAVKDRQTQGRLSKLFLQCWKSTFFISLK